MFGHHKKVIYSRFCEYKTVRPELVEWGEQSIRSWFDKLSTNNVILSGFSYNRLRITQLSFVIKRFLSENANNKSVYALRLA
jgi:hypothetical protein